jgi:hypothetical protein
MTTLPYFPQHVQARFNFMHGTLLRENGHTRPATLQEIEEKYGPDAVALIMEARGGWATLVGVSDPFGAIRAVEAVIDAMEVSR